MINIRPVSDLRNKYPEIEDLVLKEDEAVYLTKNGYGSMVVLSLEKYSQIMKQLNIEKALEAKFGNTNLGELLNELDEEIENPNTEYLNHDELFTKIRRKLNGN